MTLIGVVERKNGTKNIPSWKYRFQQRKAPGFRGEVHVLKGRLHRGKKEELCLGVSNKK